MWLVGKDNANSKFEHFGFIVDTSFSERFAEDKLFFETEDGFCIHDGVTLNKRELVDSTGFDFQKTIISLKKNSETYFKEFIGPFTGCNYDATSQKLMAYGNQTGDAALYYYCNEGEFAVSSDFNMLFAWCKKNGIQLSFNQTAANHMLSLGFLTERNTFSNEIFKLNPGEFLIYSNDSVIVSTYHRFEFGKYTITNMKDAVKEVDCMFRKAVRRCFDKDLEYGYKSHLVDMSGGLDSRMVNWVARDLGYDHIFNIGYGQSESRDREYGKIVADKLKNEFYFEELDSPDFIFDVEKLVKMNYGQAIYSGITGGERLLSHLDYSRYGLEHTGLLGGSIIDYEDGAISTAGIINPIAIAHCSIISPCLAESENYNNGEEFAFYYRFFHGTLATSYIRRNYTEAVASFMDPEFLQLCMHISPELRSNHKLYWKWIQTCYPEAAKIPSTRNRGTFRMNVYHKLPPQISRLIIRICKSVGLTSLVSDKKGMNPFDLWYANIPRVREFIEKYYSDHIEELAEYPSTYSELEKVFHGERTIDKLLALTVLGSYQVYFSEK